MGVFSSEREQALGLMRPKSRGGKAAESGKLSRQTIAEIIGDSESPKETALIVLAFLGSNMQTHHASLLTEVLSGESDITPEEAIEALLAGFHAMYR